jgi:hypothetical protein
MVILKATSLLDGYKKDMNITSRITPELGIRDSTSSLASRGKSLKWRNITKKIFTLEVRNNLGKPKTIIIPG